MSFFGTKGWITKPPPGTPIDPLHPLSQGIVGYWLFNEGTGSRAYDISGHGNHGTLTNTSPNAQNSGWGGSKFGGGLQFDGSNDYVDCGSSNTLDLNDTITSEIWMYSSGDTNYYMLAGKKGNDNPDSEGYIIFKVWGTLVVSIADGTIEREVSFEISKNVWYHVVFVLQRPTLKLYVDGIERDSIDVSAVGDITGNAYNFFVGRMGTTTTYSWVGGVDSVRIYNRALSAEEVKQLYHDPFCNLLRVPVRYVPAAPAAAIMNQFQKYNIGADLYNGAIIA